MKQNLTTGSVPKTVLVFALPYLLSYFLQTLYGMADLFITGQFYGVDSITAVANGSQVMHMITVILVGLAMGATVIIGRAVGGNRMDEAGKAVGNTVTLFMVLAAALMAVLLCLARPIVILIGTPEEAVAWEIPKAPCTLSQSPVRQISGWIICSWAHGKWALPVRRWGLRCPRLLAW